MHEDLSQVIAKHREFSGDMYHLHRQGDVILNALLAAKGRKGIKTEPLRTIYKTIRDMCEYADTETLMSEVKHRLDGLLFYQAGDFGDSCVLAEVYYNRRSWLESYDDRPPSHPIFDTGETLTEPDVAYLCNYCRECRGVLAKILDVMLTWCEQEDAPLYSYRHAHSALLRVIKEQDLAISKLFDLLNDYIGGAVDST